MDAGCQYYSTLDELEGLEDKAGHANPDQQRAALQIVADIFNHNQLTYALMGGMNFFLRGSGRTTEDVDLAVTGDRKLEETLDLLKPCNR